MEKLFLLDAYALIYRAYYALYRTPRINSKGQNTSAIFGFVNTLEEILKKQQPDLIGIAFDPKGPTFRHEAYPEYKAQREETPEDIRLSVPIIKDIIKAYNIPILEVPRYEADDVIGTLSVKAEKAGYETYMVTPDKDYGQLVTEKVLQLRPGHKSIELLGPQEIKDKYNIDDTKQVIDILGLMGDSVDNIPGCPGVGEKTATTLINKYGYIENLYEKIDEITGKLREKLETNKEQVLFSKFLVTIKLDVPIDFEPEKLKRQPIDIPALYEIFKELEFQTFIKKICQGYVPSTKDEKTVSSSKGKENPSEDSKNGVIQLDLFAKFPSNSPDDSENSILDPVFLGSAEYKLVENQEKVNEILRIILTKRIFGFSIATTTLVGINAEIVGFSLATAPHEAYFIPCERNGREAAEILNSIKEILISPEIEKVCYNLKFIQLVLSRFGMKLEGPVFDILIAHYVIQPELKHGLSYLATIYLQESTTTLERYFGTHWVEERNMRLVPEEIQIQFQCEEADIVLRLKNRLEEELKKQNAVELFQTIEMPLVNVLAHMEENGVRIDPYILRETSHLFTKRMHEYEQHVFELSGERFNLSSPKQVGAVLFGKMQLIENPKLTATGQYATGEEILEGLRNSHPVVDYLLKYRGMKKLISTYTDTLPTLINLRTNRIHASFNQAVTATGRLSSSNPNLQNIPVRGDDGKEIRKAFIPDEGCEFFSADYSQIELRIMAHLSGDKNLIDAFLHGYDIHAATAAQVYHKSIEDITPDERRKAKTANFGIVYGITTFGLAQRIGIPRSEAKELIDNYFQTFPGVKEYIQRSIEEVHQRGYIETLFHRRRYFPNINDANANVRGNQERNAINAPIQGSAADIIKVAMVRIDQRFQEEHLRSKMLLQVHDELNFSVYPDEKRKVEEIVRYEMENACQLRVPLVADCGWGANWLEAH